jgi:sulfate adenylyltransferase
VSTLDLAGEVCPFTFVRAKLRLEELPLGAQLEIFVDHAPAADNVPRSLAGEGQAVLAVERQGARWRILVEKRIDVPLRKGRTMTTEADPIPPHGGVLVDRRADAARAAELTARAPGLPRLDLHVRELADLEMIACGALSPLDGFMRQADYRRVVDEGRLADGLPWTIPVVLSAPRARAADWRPGQEVALYARPSEGGALHAVLEVAEVYAPDKEREAKNVYGTALSDEKHPGVAQLRELDELYVGGAVWLVSQRPSLFPAYHNEPRATRALFRERGWKRIAAFQTRNPIHRAHEYLTKCALEIADGVLIHPLVGYTKDDDIPAPVRMRCYEALLEGYYPRDRTMLSTLPAAMRYAGPKEAIFHAIMRKNYGCTHFIVGRDHAGVGSYYGTYDAQREFDRYRPEELGITPLRFENSFYCRRCSAMASQKTCPHGETDRVILSGTKVRELLRAGEEPPAEFSRPEVARILIEAMRANA